MSLALFYVFIAAAVLGSLAVLRIQNIFHAALAFLVVVLCLAGIYVFLAAEFLGIVLLLVYAGGIVVILIFGIMITARAAGRPLTAASRRMGFGLAAGALLFGLLWHVIVSAAGAATPVLAAPVPYIRQLGGLLMSRHSLAFELAGILLLVSLLAAAVIIPTSLKKDD